MIHRYAKYLECEAGKTNSLFQILHINFSQYNEMSFRMNGFIYLPVGFGAGVDLGAGVPAALASR